MYLEDNFMSKLKGKIIGIRFTAEERDALEKEAETQCMSLSQFIRYKLLEEDHNPIENEPTKTLYKALPLLSRMIIDGYMRIHKISEKNLSDNELAEIYKTTSEQFTKLGIQVE